MKNEVVRPNRGYLTILFFLIILILMLAYSINDYMKRLNESVEREAIVVAERDSLRTLLRETGTEAGEALFLSPIDVNRLKRMGLAYPLEDIKNDLLRRNDIIPHKGIMGGEMGFYSPENIHILNTKWVYAHFEDGHIRGEMILEYKINNDSSISWNVLDSVLD